MKIITVVTTEAHQEVVVLVPLNHQRPGGEGGGRKHSSFTPFSQANTALATGRSRRVQHVQWHAVTPSLSSRPQRRSGLPACTSPFEKSVPLRRPPLQDSQPTLGALGMRACRQPAGHRAGKGENGNADEKLVGFRGGGTQMAGRKEGGSGVMRRQDSARIVTRL